MPKTKTVCTKGSAWLQKLTQHKVQDYANRPPIWCKYISSLENLDITQTSGYSLQAKFIPIDNTVRMEEHTFLVVARGNRTKQHSDDKMHYDIKLIYCDGDRVFEVTEDYILDGINLLLENKHIDNKQARSAKSNKLYACALCCYSRLSSDAGKRFDPATVVSPVQMFASRKPRRRVTRIAEIEQQQQEEQNELEELEEFQP